MICGRFFAISAFVFAATFGPYGESSVKPSAIDAPSSCPVFHVPFAAALTRFR